MLRESVVEVGPLGQIHGTATDRESSEVVTRARGRERGVDAAI